MTVRLQLHDGARAAAVAEVFWREVQAALTAHGFPCGSIDGVAGEATRGALRAFKARHGLAATDFPGPQTVALLFSMPDLAGNPLPPPAFDGEPLWLRDARGDLGVREIKGARHNPTILAWWKAAHLPFTDDETPYCAGFVGAKLENAGIRSTRSALARSYERFGVDLGGPAVGAIVPMWRGSRTSGQGHVGFCVGRDRAGHVMVLGANQSDTVSVAAFDVGRVLSWRWPAGHPRPASTAWGALPLVSSDGRASRNEA